MNRIKILAGLVLAAAVVMVNANIASGQQCNVQQQQSVSSAAAIQNQAIADTLLRLQQQQLTAAPRAATTATAVASSAPSVSQLSSLAQRSRSVTRTRGSR
jgi:hypothetical protein